MADGYNIINSQTVSHVQKKSVENDLTVENSPVDLTCKNGERELYS